jgi:hypothetical protein
MRRYFIQDGPGLPDFCYEAIRAAEYANWLEPGSVEVWRAASGCRLPEGPGTPIGSIEFVKDVALAQGARHFAEPMNVPGSLASLEFSGRAIWKRVTKESVSVASLPTRVFAKSATAFKGFTAVLRREDLWHAIDEHGPLDLAEEVEFADEWRAFVHAGRLVGLHCYTGLFASVPSRGFLSRVIGVLAQSNPNLRSYTVDVGFIEDAEAVVEVHPFVACGLYGFRDYRVLLTMFDRGYDSFTCHFS